MRTQPGACERILREINSRLCSGVKQLREEHWRSLVYSLRQLGHDPESVTDAVMELLSVAGGRLTRGSSIRLLHREYQKLSTAEREEVEEQYRRCFRAAKADFPQLFHVQVINVPASPADVLLAEQAPGNELPRLNADQKSIAKAFGIPDEEYARSVVAKHFSEERYRFYAERCWDFLMDAARAHSVNVVDVIYDVSSGRFYCDLQQNGCTRRFFLDARLVSEPLQHGDKIGLDRAREAIRFAVEEALARRLGSAKG
jgi:hypothetical protein